MISEALVVKILAFTGAACAVIAQAEAVPDLARYISAAIAAGCAAVLALTRAPGQPAAPTPIGGKG